ncbi:unnamed protein product [Durusdinium trenchii]|uniref:Uncharacterized protein n=1 Tax=Durusdinium trenchii TaxID=1381693 RepID=A0ABP0P9M6_9DINO
MGERAMGDKRSELLERLLRPNEVAAKKFEAQGAKAVAQAQVQGCGQTIHSEENMLDVDISTMSPQEKAQYVDALFRQWDPTPDSLRMLTNELKNMGYLQGYGAFSTPSPSFPRQAFYRNGRWKEEAYHHHRAQAASSQGWSATSSPSGAR